MNLKRCFSIIFCSLILITSCVSHGSIDRKPNTPTKTSTKTHQPSEKPLTVEIKSSDLSEEVAIWVATEFPKRCKELGIPLPLKVTIFDVESPTVYTTEGVFIGWINGVYYYNTEVIQIWIRFPAESVYVSQKKLWKEIKHTLYHELLHHYDNQKGIKCPDDHNDLFTKRIKALGWL